MGNGKEARGSRGAVAEAEAKPTEQPATSSRPQNVTAKLSKLIAHTHAQLK